ncbi:MAG TPA: helix-turn-helix transcriptional regulator [Anaerolineaceae bacterium]|nr:helix-turn-helix transcriptional regulator [Anaerolineaceae bacterium]
MTTRLLFLPNDQTFLLLETALDPAALADAVESGIWHPPAPFESACPPLRALNLGWVVIIFPAQPLEPAPGEAEGLTPRQGQVLQALADGLTTKEIARRMGVSVRTVRWHIAELKTRVGARTREQSVSRAAALGLARPRRKPRFPG